MHLGGQDETGLLSVARWREHYDAQQWREALELGLAAADLARPIRQAARTGRPFGPDAFLPPLETQTRQRLRRQRPGPKPKSTAAGSP